jgi:hypothetical protein
MSDSERRWHLEVRAVWPSGGKITNSAVVYEVDLRSTIARMVDEILEIGEDEAAGRANFYEARFMRLDGGTVTA